MVEKIKEQQIQQNIQIHQEKQEQINAGEQFKDQQQEQQQEKIELVNMPVNLTDVKLADDADNPDDFAEEVKQTESVAMNGTYQEVNEKVDGHYMTKLKNELNKENALRDDSGSIPLVDYTEKQIEELNNEGTLNAVAKKMDSIISICRKYRLTHLVTLSKEGQKRKAEVKAVEKKAKEKLAACKARLKKIKEDSDASGLSKKKTGTVMDQATSGGRAVWNYVGAGLGFTLGNIWNTVGMVGATALWPIASLIKSAAYKRWTGISIPHPHSFNSWYNVVLKNQMNSLSDAQGPEVEEEVRENRRVIYNEASFHSPKVRWHHFLVMK